MTTLTTTTDTDRLDQAQTHQPNIQAPQPDLGERVRTYDRFVFWSLIFTAHVVVILDLLAIFTL